MSVPCFSEIYNGSVLCSNYPSPPAYQIYIPTDWTPHVPTDTLYEKPCCVAFLLFENGPQTPSSRAQPAQHNEIRFLPLKHPRHDQKDKPYDRHCCTLLNRLTTPCSAECYAEHSSGNCYYTRCAPAQQLNYHTEVANEVLRQAIRTPRPQRCRLCIHVLQAMNPQPTRMFQAIPMPTRKPAKRSSFG